MHANSGYPLQTDASACGILTLVIMYHHVMGKTVNQMTQVDVPDWRKFIASKIHSIACD